MSIPGIRGETLTFSLRRRLVAARKDYRILPRFCFRGCSTIVFRPLSPIKRATDTLDLLHVADFMGHWSWASGLSREHGARDGSCKKKRWPTPVPVFA